MRPELFRDIDDDRVREMIEELCDRILSSFPEAKFCVLQDRPKTFYLKAYTGAEDEYEILDLVNNRAVDFLVEEEVAIYVIPLPLEAAESQSA